MMWWFHRAKCLTKKNMHECKSNLILYLKNNFLFGFGLHSIFVKKMINYIENNKKR